MTIRLKQRLAIGVGVVLLGSALVWNSGTLRAQNKANNSAEEISKQFIADLTSLNVTEKRHAHDTYFFI